MAVLERAQFTLSEVGSMIPVKYINLKLNNSSQANKFFRIQINSFVE